MGPARMDNLLDGHRSRLADDVLPIQRGLFPSRGSGGSRWTVPAHHTYDRLALADAACCPLLKSFIGDTGNEVAWRARQARQPQARMWFNCILWTLNHPPEPTPSPAWTSFAGCWPSCALTAAGCS